MNKRKQTWIPAVGGSSLLVIFAVLCLTVFALLSLSTVLADQRLAAASASAVRAYYEADCMAEEMFARLRTGEIPDGVEVHEDKYRYQCRISETQVLCVEVMQNEETWTVLRWQAVAEVEPEELGIPVWGG